MTTIIGIAGGSASGKTTVAERLFESSKPLGSIVMIRFDDYYKDLSFLPIDERRKVNFDHPDSVDIELLIKHLKDLKTGKAIDQPTYDFTMHNRSKETKHLEPCDMIILEGIFTLTDERIRDLCDIKIFVEIDADIRFIRRLTRDVNQRGRNVDDVIRQYLDTVRPMYLEFIEPSKRYADIIIPKGGFNHVAIDMVKAQISSILSKKVL